MPDKPKRPKRAGITVLELTRAFPDEDAARRWFEDVLWPDGDRYCPRCGSVDTYECSHAKMPYRCRDCRKYFGVKTGTVMAGSPIPLLKLLFAIYLDLTSLKGVSSMKLHRGGGEMRIEVVVVLSQWAELAEVNLVLAHPSGLL